MNNPILSTRILPGLTAEHAIVALPSWAWIWIDDYVTRCYNNDYAAFIADAGVILKNDEQSLSLFLSTLAEDLRDFQMRNHYYLANDNIPDRNSLRRITLTRGHKRSYPRQLKFPTIFKLFKFVAHATDMQTIWQRKHYHEFY